MHKEHAIVMNELDQQQLEYILKKANRLGQCGREIHSVVKETDNDGIEHLIFITDPPKIKHANCS